MAVEALEPEGRPAAASKPAGGSSPELVATLKPIYTRFLKELKATDCVRFESERLMKAVMEHAQSTGLVIEPGTVSYQTLMVGYSMADVRDPHPRDTYFHRYWQLWSQNLEPNLMRDVPGLTGYSFATRTIPSRSGCL